MLSKIIILVAICAAVYIVTQRQKLFPALFGEKPDNPGESSGRQHTRVDTIEELDYDPKTGHYRVKNSKNGKT